ncbi:alginate lyase family protein [Microvirga splendida]|uniref:Alginate lyase family protein n=1 Tax=Microvirga splendida TaxID=2795727 RepID=A0ABS0Y6E9_9HYPH|nr:alginate lyase family protein [Microvirga splendida]MBJ6127876.1 alginate lyase family protein [Microvirga splendida]
MVWDSKWAMSWSAVRYALHPPVIATFLLAASLSAAQAQGPGYLVPPPATDNVQSKPKYECDTPAAPVITLDTQSKYKQDDTQRATIDEDAEETYSEAVEPLRAYGRNLVRIANAYVKSNPKNTAAAACTLTWLDAWASANAMTDMRSKQAHFNLGQALGGFALAYLQVRNAPGLATDQKQRVEAWLKKLGQKLVGFMDKNKAMSGRNNHRYWAGLGATAAGLASDDKVLTRWGLDSVRIGLAQITPDGTLPLEMKRGKRARDYHIFAAEPLVTAAELARSQGIDLYAEHNGALKRLVDRVLASLDDPSFFEKATGSKQEAYPGDGTVPSSRIAWLEIHQSRHPSPEAEDVLSEKRPTGSSEIGGNTTLLFHGTE